MFLCSIYLYMFQVREKKDNVANACGIVYAINMFFHVQYASKKSTGTFF